MALTTNNFLISSDNNLKLKGLKDTDDNFVNDASVSGVLKDNWDNVIDSNISFTADGSNGNYSATLPDTTNFREGVEYQLFITAEKANEKATFKEVRTAKYLEF